MVGGQAGQPAGPLVVAQGLVVDAQLAGRAPQAGSAEQQLGRACEQLGVLDGERSSRAWGRVEEGRRATLFETLLGALDGARGDLVDGRELAGGGVTHLCQTGQPEVALHAVVEAVEADATAAEVVVAGVASAEEVQLLGDRAAVARWGVEDQLGACEGVLVSHPASIPHLVSISQEYVDNHCSCQ